MLSLDDLLEWYSIPTDSSQAKLEPRPARSHSPLSLSVFLSYVDSLFTRGNSDLPARPLTTQIGTA